MKIRYIILIFAIVFGSFFCFRDCIKQYYLQSEKMELTPISYVFTKDAWKSFNSSSSAWITDYEFTEIKLKDFQERRNWVKNFTDNMTNLQDSLQNISPKTEIVYVRQIVSFYTMNSPEHQETIYRGNKEKSIGRGAMNELFNLIRLSDGKIIKASTHQNSEWLGVQSGEKVLKTTAVKLKAKKEGKVSWYPLDSQIIRHWRNVTSFPSKDYWNVFHELKLENTIEYKPLYSM